MSSLITVRRKVTTTTPADTSDAYISKAVARMEAIKRIDGVAEYLMALGHVTTDWTIELPRSYVYNSRHDLGFDVSPAPRHFEDGHLIPDGFKAEVVDYCRWGASLSDWETRQLGKIAAHIFSLRLAAATLHDLGISL